MIRASLGVDVGVTVTVTVTILVVHGVVAVGVPELLVGAGITVVIGKVD